MYSVNYPVVRIVY